jgi:ribosomal-protein-serine acetyltransferase
MNKMLLEIPMCFETERLILRCYEPGDGAWYFSMSQRNREHLLPFEAQNPALSIHSEADAEILVRELIAQWVGRKSFFLGAFDKTTREFVAQIYVGPVNWELPEFEMGFFVDKDQEGQGYITEAATSTVNFVFEHLKAWRIRMECDDTNERSIKVAERCGFVREGHIRQNKKNPDGTFSGTLIYGLLRSEFEL